MKFLSFSWYLQLKYIPTKYYTALLIYQTYIRRYNIEDSVYIFKPNKMFFLFPSAKIYNNEVLYGYFFIEKTVPNFPFLKCNFIDYRI